MKIDLDAIELMVAAGASGAVVLAYLRILDAKQAPKREVDRKRKKRKPTETVRPEANDLDAKGKLYRRAEEVCGQKSGGIVTNLLVANGGDVPTVSHLIETAAGKSNPRDYLTGTMKGSANGTIKGAFAELRLELGGEGDGGQGDRPMRDVTPKRAGAG